MPTMSAKDAIRAMNSGSHTLVDVREPHEWAAGHSPIAVSLPMSQLNERIGELPSDRTLAIVCHAGSRSARVTAALLAAGYDAVNVEGGMISWVQSGGSIVNDGPGEPTVD